MNVGKTRHFGKRGLGCHGRVTAVQKWALDVKRSVILHEGVALRVKADELFIMGLNGVRP